MKNKDKVSDGKKLDGDNTLDDVYFVDKSKDKPRDKPKIKK